MKRWIILLSGVLSCIIAVSCAREENAVPEETPVRLRLLLEERAVNKAAPEVNETAVSDLNVFLYNKEDRLAYFCYTENPGGEVVLEIVPGQKYSVYAIANCGDLTGSTDISTRHGVESLAWEIGAAMETVNASGAVPMSGFIEETLIEKGGTLSLRLTRLLAKFRIIMDISALDPEVSIFEVERIRLMNMNRKVGYFKESRATTPDDIITDGITLEGEELNSVFTTGVDLYLPENVQGELLPENTDEKTHIPPEFYRNLCTYVEFHVKLRNREHYNDRMIYRYYLHDGSPDNFDVRRNTMYTCRTVFTGTGINDADSRIDASSMKDLVTSISVSPSSRKFIKKGETYTYSTSILPLSAENKAVTWSSDNHSVATVDQNGKVTAVGDGTCTITARAADGSGVYGTALAEVDIYKYPTSVKIYPEEVFMYHVEEFQLRAEVLPENATDKSVTWKALSNVFEVTPDGIIRMISPNAMDKYPKTTGYAIATSSANSLADTIQVTMEKLTIDVPPVSIGRGQSCDLQFLAEYVKKYDIEFVQIDGFEYFKLSGSVVTAFSEYCLLAGRVEFYYKDFPQIRWWTWISVM